LGLVIDTSTPFGERVERQLEEQQVAWLTTTGRDDTPQPNPIWFVRDGDTVVILSEPNQAKLRNIERTGRAAFHFDESPGGGITILTGSAAVTDLAAIDPDVLARYAAKYEEPMRGINYTWDTFSQTYNMAIRITPEKLRGW
jgi:PPOX class probable F420-dependent enzyme